MLSGIGRHAPLLRRSQEMEEANNFNQLRILLKANMQSTLWLLSHLKHIIKRATQTETVRPRGPSLQKVHS